LSLGSVGVGVGQSGRDQLLEDFLVLSAGDVEGVEQLRVIFREKALPEIRLILGLGFVLSFVFVIPDDQVLHEPLEDVSLEPLTPEVPDGPLVGWEGDGGGRGPRVLGGRGRWWGRFFVFDEVAVHPSHQFLVVVNVTGDAVGRILQPLANAVQLVETLDARVAVDEARVASRKLTKLQRHQQTEQRSEEGCHFVFCVVKL